MAIRIGGVARRSWLLALSVLSGCVSSDVTPVSKDVVLVSTSAAPACGGQGARKVAFMQAAAETLRRGYDRFIVVGADSRSDVRVVGTTPLYGTTSLYGSTYGSTLGFLLSIGNLRTLS